MIKSLTKFTFATLTAFLLAAFDQVAIMELGNYGLIYRGIVWAVIAYHILAAIVHGALYFGELTAEVEA